MYLHSRQPGGYGGIDHMDPLGIPHVTKATHYIVICMFYGTVIPDSKVHGTNMGPTWILSAPGGPHVGPMNFAIRVMIGGLDNTGSQLLTHEIRTMDGKFDIYNSFPDSKDHGAYLGPTGPRWAHVGHMNFAIWVPLPVRTVKSLLRLERHTIKLLHGFFLCSDLFWLNHQFIIDRYGLIMCNLYWFVSVIRLPICYNVSEAMVKNMSIINANWSQQSKI